MQAATENLFEETFFFDIHGASLFAFLHRPVSDSKGHGFVFCHPFGEEKLWTHRVYVELARKLAEYGYPVLRFDYRGYGDSAGEFSETSVSTRLEDIQGASSELRARVPDIERVSLFGLRFGATLAVEAARKQGDYASLVLWEPVLDGKKYINEVLRSQLTIQLSAWGGIRQNRKQMEQEILAGKTVFVDGYPISKNLFVEIAGLDLSSVDNQIDSSCLVMQVDRDSGRPVRTALNVLADLFSNGSVELAVEQPFWRETRFFYPRADNAMAQTLAWVENDHRNN